MSRGYFKSDDNFRNRHRNKGRIVGEIQLEAIRKEAYYIEKASNPTQLQLGPRMTIIEYMKEKGNSISDEDIIEYMEKKMPKLDRDMYKD